MGRKERMLLALVAVSMVIAIALVGLIATYDTEANAEDGVVAKIGDEGFTSLEAAWNEALKRDDNTIIDLVTDSSGNGLQIPDGSSFNSLIMLNLNGHTYEFTGGAVGSRGTENQALHLNGGEDCFVSIDGSGTDGNIGKLVVRSSASSIKLFCMNYVALTIKDVTIDLSGAPQITRGITSCEDTLMITGKTDILMGKGRDAIVNDMFGDHGNSYITFDKTFTGTIDGDICVWVEDGAKGEIGNITIDTGTFLGTIGKVYTGSEDTSRIKIYVHGGTFMDIFNAARYAIPDAYLKLYDNIGTASDPDDRSITVDETQTLTLDFNGKWIYSSAKKTINNMGTLVIRDSTKEPGGIVNGLSGYTIIKNFGQGILIISDINVLATDTTENGTRIAVKQDDFNKEGGDVVTEQRGRIVINSGTFTATQAIQAWGNVIINGGTFNGQITAITQAFTRGEENINDTAGTISVNGGTFNSNFICVSMESWTDMKGEMPTIVIDADKIKVGDSVKSIDIRMGYVKDTTNNFIEQKDCPKKSSSIPGVIIKGTLPKNVNLYSSVSVTSTYEGEEVTTYLAYFEDAVKSAGLFDGDVRITLLKDISAISSDGEGDIFLFSDTEAKITIDGNGKTITCVSAQTNTSNIVLRNIIGFGSNVTAKIENLTIDGKDIALSGINICDSANITVSEMLIINVKKACIEADSCTLIVNDCELDSTKGVGGIYIHSESKKAYLTIDGMFSGSVWTDTNSNVTVTYQDVVAKVTSKIDSGRQTGDWGWWFSYGDDDTAAWINSLLVDGDVTVTGDLTLKDIEITVLKERTLTMTSGSTLTGTVTGPAMENKFIANGLKASGAITFTGGSLIINGKITSTNTTVAGVTVTISGDSIIIEGSLEKGATMEIQSGTTVTIDRGTTFTSKGTIKNNGTIDNNGTMTNSGTLKMIGSSIVTGTIVNEAVIADERKSGEAVKTDGAGVVVSKDNASAYEGTGTKVIVEDPEAIVTEGMVTIDSTKYPFVNAVTTTDELIIIMNDGLKQYTITIPEGTTIDASTIISVEYVRSTSNTTDYRIETGGITDFGVKVPVQKGFKNAKVTCDGLEQGISNVRYNSTTGYVTFDAGHNSLFSITLSNDASSVSSDAIDSNVAFIGATALLVISILALAAVIMRR